MEAHPVPQNVTSFEFHLIGDMTLKQFGYLASGLGISYFLFITIGTTLPFIAWPLIVIFASLGAFFAFIPIGDRPLDHWLIAFLQAITKPTQRSWNKPGYEQLYGRRLSLYLSTPQPLEPQIIRQPNLSVVSQMAPKNIPIINEPTPPKQTSQNKEESILPTPEELEQTVELAKKAQAIQTEIVETEHQLNLIKASAAAPGADPKSFAQDFQKILSDLQNLSNQASDISKQITSISKIQTAPVFRKVVPASSRVVPTSLTLTSTPNVINGVVTDSTNHYLEGVIVVTHNSEGLPVRALKTNKLGQFVAATPLANGKYVLSLEKDNLTFDNIELTLEGKVIQPVVISAKRLGA